MRSYRDGEWSLQGAFKLNATQIVQRYSIDDSYANIYFNPRHGCFTVYINGIYYGKYKLLWKAMHAIYRFLNRRRMNKWDMY